MYSIYMHTSPSGKRYIGITSQKPKDRWKNGKGYSSNKYFTRAIQHYGWENFKHEILKQVETLDEAKTEEIKMISYYRSNERDFGYNISAGGDGCNFNLSEEEKRKRRYDRQKQYLENPENRRRRNEWEREYCKTEDYKRKKNEYNKTEKRKEHRREYMREYRKTEKNKEYRNKCSKAYAEKLKSQCKQRLGTEKFVRLAVLQFDEEMNLVNQYSSIVSAARAVGTCDVNIRRACYAEHLRARGYYWRLKDDFVGGHKEQGGET